MIRVHTFNGNWNLPDPIDERIKTTPEDHEPYEYEQWVNRLRDQGYVIDALPLLYPGQVRRIRAVNRATDETAFYFASHA